VHHSPRALYFVDSRIRQQVLEMRGLCTPEGHDDDAFIPGNVAFCVSSTQKFEIVQAKLGNCRLNGCLILISDLCSLCQPVGVVEAVGRGT
jgi:hypothetical protein